MSEYVPQVGDRVRKHDWAVDGAITVLGYDEATGQVWARYPKGQNTDVWDTGPWIKVAWFPECWINVYSDGFVGNGLSTRKFADANAANTNPDRIGVIHLHPDGTLTMEEP